MRLVKFLRQNDHAQKFICRSRRIYCVASESNAEFFKRADHAKVEDEGKRTTRRQRQPKSHSVSQHRRHQQEHRQRWQHVSECRLRMRSNALGVAGIMPQPEYAEDRNQRQRHDKCAERRRPTRHFRYDRYDDAGQRGFYGQIEHQSAPADMELGTLLGG